MNVPKQFHDLPENLHSGVVEIGDQPTPTDREIVRARWPDAIPIPRSSGLLWDIVLRDGTVIGTGLTHDGAWADAAAKLAQPEEPLMEICPVCGKKECDCHVTALARVEQPASEGGGARYGYMRHVGNWQCIRCEQQVPYDPNWSVMAEAIGKHYAESHPTPPATGEAAKLAAVPKSTAEKHEMQPYPKAAWDDPRVQKIYEILCDDRARPASEEHWEGFCARRIVDELLPVSPIAGARSPAPVGDVEQAELPLLESCPEEMRHGYPDCDCDLEGGDPGCTKKPTMAEVVERYGPLKQRERQLRAERVAHKATREENQELRLNLKSAAEHFEKAISKAEAENQELRRKVEALTFSAEHFEKAASKAEAELATMREERKKALVLIKDWWAHPSAHSNPVGPMLREVLALLPAKEGK